MENKITFQEQYNKIVNAYMNNTLEPFDCAKCFIGNLLGTDLWMYNRYLNSIDLDNSTLLLSSIPNIRKLCDTKENQKYEYSIIEICLLETNFLSFLPREDNLNFYEEENLFNAMESTLLILRDIHEKRGEVIKNYVFEKRELEAV